MESLSHWNNFVKFLLSGMLIAFAFGANYAQASYLSEVLADSPAGYWRLDETSGNTAMDLSGNNRHGTYVGGVTLGTSSAITDGNSTSATFDGSTGYVSLPGTWGDVAEVTIEAWANTSADAGIQAMVSSNDSGQFCHFQLSETLSPSSGIGCYGPDPGFVLVAPDTQPINTWRHIAITLGAGTASLYIDGNLIQSAPITTSNIAGSSVVSIARGFLDGRYFNGALDEVAIYYSVLPAGRILAHYEAGTPPPLTVSVNSVEVPESAPNAVLIVALSEAQTTSIKVDYETVDGTANDGLDYTGRSGSMTFAPGQVEKKRYVQLIDDDLVEGTETFSFLLSNPVGAGLGEAVGEVTIIDNDGPTISVNSIEVSEDSHNAVLAVSLSEAQTTPVDVDFQTVDGTADDGFDYMGRAGSMTFAPGQVEKNRYIQLIDDGIVEATESFNFLLSNPVGAGLGEAVGEIIIIDDDGPTISIEPASHAKSEGAPGGSMKTIVYTIILSAAHTEQVFVDYQTMDETAVGGVDYLVRAGTMTFEPGQTSKVRGVKIIGDTQVEPDETFKLVLSNPSSNAMVDVNEIDSRGTILNDDQPD